LKLNTEKQYISSFNLQSAANGSEGPTRSEGPARLISVQKAVGARIVQLRKKKQTSQEAFAYSCGLHRSHMGELERGQSNFTLSTLLLVVKQLDITISELFKGIG
jgi:DNA-binding XRE family transcriptional regulator